MERDRWFDAVMRDADVRLLCGPEPVLLVEHPPCAECGNWAGGNRFCDGCQAWRDWQELCQQGRPE